MLLGADENFIVPHNKPFLLSMANAGPNTNGSQFFITCSRQEHLNGKHTVFGEVIEGTELVRTIERSTTGERDRPLRPVVIADCGVLRSQPDKSKEMDHKSRSDDRMQEDHKQSRRHRSRSASSDSSSESRDRKKRKRRSRTPDRSRSPDRKRRKDRSASPDRKSRKDRSASPDRKNKKTRSPSEERKQRKGRDTSRSPEKKSDRDSDKPSASIDRKARGLGEERPPERRPRPFEGRPSREDSARDYRDSDRNARRSRITEVSPEPKPVVPRLDEGGRVVKGRGSVLYDGAVMKADARVDFDGEQAPEVSWVLLLFGLPSHTLFLFC